MTQRIEYRSISPDLYDAMTRLNTASRTSSLDARLVELVNIRASQINGCAYCLSLHILGGRKVGLTDEQIDMVAVWREAGSVFSPRERAVLAWTESLTLLPQSHAPDEIYDGVRSYFNEQETVELSWAITVINGWNRIAVAMRVPPRRLP